MSKIKHINYQSDFSIRFVFPTAIPQYDWRMRFSIGMVNYDVTNTDNVLSDNCKKIDDSTIEVYFDNHQFPCGFLKCVLMERKPDENYKDGYKNVYTPYIFPVYLWDRAADEYDKISLDLTADILEMLDNKVDKVEGKGLSSNDFTDDEKKN